jgi:outer membrane biosynthesis protein TonB
MTRAELSSLRLSRSDTERLILALLLSLSVHLAVWGGYELGKKLGWWREWHVPAWLHKTAKKTPPPLVLAQEEAQPTIFVDVTQPEAEPPKKTLYYSDKNSHAGNPDEDKNSNQPKLNGKQKDIPKAEDTPRMSRQKPSAPQQQLRPSPEKQPDEAADPSSPMNLGDQKPKQVAERTTTEQKPSPQQQQRPRTLKQVAEQQHLPGLQMHQDGGAHRRLSPSFDVRATPFGDYDRALIDAVQNQWDSLLDSQKFAEDRTGRVVIRFDLEYDGTVRNLEVLENGVGEVLSYVCQAAIEDSAPFGKWPDEMRQEIGANSREITFTFDYY